MPGKHCLACEHCGQQQTFEPTEGAIRAIAYESTAPLRTETPQSEVQCKACGARVMQQKQAARCPFCDSAMVVPLPAEPQVAPQGVLPFAVDRPTAQAHFAKWLRSRWFAPSSLAAKAKQDGLDGVYLPYWAFSASTTTSYTGQRGDYYYETVTRRDANGRTRTEQVRRTRWWPASGTVFVPFTDVLVAGSRSLPEPLIDTLEPWPLAQANIFDARYLAGFAAERIAVPIDSGLGRAKEKMEPAIRSAICNDIGGDEQRISHADTSYSDVVWKHILLPLWISAYAFGERVFRITVNAHTGEVAGERPYSWIKITLAVLAVTALIVAIVIASQKQ